MFWRVASFNQTSPVEAVLDRPDFTLEDLLEEDDLIQECKALNSRLIDFLKLPESVAKLLEYVTQPAGLDADDKRQFKYPFSSAEVLCCEVDAIFSTLLEDGALCGALFALLDQPRPLDCMLAGYFARVLVCLLMRRSRDLLRYLKDNQQHLPKLVAHMENTSVAEALAHLLGADDLSATFMAPGDLAWLADTRVLQDLLDTLGSTAGGPARENAAIVLSAVARSNTCPLTHALGSAEFLDQLLTRATASGGSAAEVAQALDVPIALLERRAALEAARQQYPSESGPTDADICVEEQTAAAVAAHASLLAGMLEPADSSAVQLTPFGCLAPPLGLARVKVAELFAALLGVGSAPAGEAIAAAGVLQRTLALVLQFPFNNILHAQATRMLLASLEYGDDSLLGHLFTECDLIGWLTSAPEQVAPSPSPPAAADQQGKGSAAAPDVRSADGGGSRAGAGSDRGSSPSSGVSPAASGADLAASAASGVSKGSSAGSSRRGAEAAGRERAPLRAGYLGHLTLVANRMIGAAGRRRTVKRFLDDSDAWATFVNGALRERNSNEDTSAWQCGRPDPRSVPTNSAPLDADEPGAASFSEEEMEKLPGGYGGANSPLGSPTAAGNDRYAGEGGANFGDVEEDEGASGNPGVSDLQQSSKGDGQEHVDVLIDAVKALDALRLGEGPRGRSPTLAAAGGALSSPPPSSAAPSQPAQMSSEWEAETDAAGTAASNDAGAGAASSSPKAASPQGAPSPAEQQVADVAVDLFRSPRSKGGFGKVDDWADFPEPSASGPPPASPGPLPSLLAVSAPPNSPVSAAPLASVRTTANKVSSFKRGPRGSSSPKAESDAAGTAAAATGATSPPELPGSIAPVATRRRSLDALSPGSTAASGLAFGHGSGSSSGSSGSSPRSPGHSGHALAPLLPIAEPAVMPPEGSIGPPSPAARVGSPNTMLALPLASSLSPGSPSRLAAPSLLHWPATSQSRLGSGEASPGRADAAADAAASSTSASAASSVGGNGAAAAPAAVVLPHGQLSASLAAAAAGASPATGVVVPVKAVPVQPMAVGGVSDPPRPPPSGNAAASSANHVPAAQGAHPAAAAPGATANSSPAASAPASVGNWADFGAAFAGPNDAKAPAPGAAPSPDSPPSPPPRQRADSEVQLEESQSESLSPFKRTGSLRAHNFWAFEDTPASETDSDRDD